MTYDKQTNTVSVVDKETGADIKIQNPNFYSPSIPTQDKAYKETSVVELNGTKQTIEFNYPDGETNAFSAEGNVILSSDIVIQHRL